MQATHRISAAAFFGIAAVDNKLLRIKCGLGANAHVFAMVR